jgi:hypothetical protein
MYEGSGVVKEEEGYRRGYKPAAWRGTGESLKRSGREASMSMTTEGERWAALPPGIRLQLDGILSLV